jgi:hypothetical protein
MFVHRQVENVEQQIGIAFRLSGVQPLHDFKNAAADKLDCIRAVDVTAVKLL